MDILKTLQSNSLYYRIYIFQVELFKYDFVTYII